MRIVIQGEKASFHHTVAKQWFGSGMTLVPADSFPKVFSALQQNEADAAVIAIENSLYGSIHKVYDLLEKHRYPIIGEIHLPIHQQLISSGTTQDITRIYSHPVALAQCEAYLDNNFPNAERLEFHDTASAVEYIAQLNDPQLAAIAGTQAAVEYDLPIVAHNIEDNEANSTRFLVIQPDGTIPPDANRTSLVVVTNHTPGSLAKILTIIADAGINLSKLQSRPITGSPWKYRFYIVVDTAGAKLHETLEHIRPFTQSITILGEYKHNP